MERKLFDLTFADFLKLLRDRGRGEKADGLEKRIILQLSPPLSKAQVMGMTVEAIGLAAEIASLFGAMKRKQSRTVAGRIRELEEEGFSVLPGERNG